MRTRFAPSPTGLLHLGHAYSAMLAHDMAQREGGEFQLRIEDIDRQRSKPEWEAAIYDDLKWLGLTWETPVMRQSERLDDYSKALDGLWSRDLLYPCDCTRRDITDALGAPQEAAQAGPDGPVYPGTCRDKRSAECVFQFRSDHPRRRDLTLRLDMATASGLVTEQHLLGPPVRKVSTIGFNETGCGPNGERGWIETTTDDLTNSMGDLVLARRDMGTSYHLSVVIDDAAQRITHVTRGEDLFEATRIHVLLQKLLQIPTPTYHHHSLIRDKTGKRLAKRDDARSIRSYRADGATPEDIRRMVGLA
jgi:glutamyl-Q tRNA(Asp) synthetase